MEGHGPTPWVQNFPIPFSQFTEHAGKYEHVNSGILVTAIIIVFSLLAARNLRGREAEHIVPPSRATVAGLADFLMEALYNMVKGTLGASTSKYFPFIGTLFLFILVSNLFGMLPYSGAPTNSLSTNLALGLCSFIFFNAVGIKNMGLKNYIAHFKMGLDFGPGAMGIVIGFVGLLVFGLEVFSSLLRPITLSARLGLNINVDHLILHTFQNLVAWIVPVPLMLLGLVVCTIQAFVFATLTAVYIQLAEEHHDHAHEHGAADHH